ncbi:MAG: PH domain-containing protein [Patescibacteria group bacterium]
MSKNKISLLPDEKKLFELEHHAVVVFPHILFSIVILLLDFFMMYYLFLQGWWGVILFGSVFLVVLFYVWRMIFLWKKNRVIITDKRILDLEQIGFFEHYTSEFSLSEIKAVETENRGIGAKICGYGNLRFVFFDGQVPFEIYKVKNSVAWQQKISEELRKQEGKKPTSAVDLLTEEISKLKPEEKAQIVRNLSEQNIPDKDNLDV